MGTRARTGNEDKDWNGHEDMDGIENGSRNGNEIREEGGGDREITWEPTKWQ